MSIDSNLTVDLVLEYSKIHQIIWILFFEYFDRMIYSQIVNLINNKATSNEDEEPIQLPNEIYFVCSRLERNIARENQTLHLQDKNIKLSYFIEYDDINRSFEDDDWLIVEDLKFRGFNFSSIDVFLNVLKKLKGKGQYSIIAVSSSGDTKVLWEGILFPKEFLKNR
jgi:hypothetical protein